MNQSKTTLLMVALVLIPIGLVVSGFFTQVLWNILVVPIFSQAPLEFAHAVGIAILVNYAKMGTVQDGVTGVGELIALFVKSIITSILIVICAIVVSMFF